MIKRFFKNNFNLFCSKLKFQKGFMLAEVLLVITISLLLTLVVVANYKEGQKKVILQRAAHKLAQDIRAAQEMAVSGSECIDCGPLAPNGYGIEFRTTGDNSLYKLYADTVPPYGFYSGDDIEMEVIQLENNVVIKDIIISFIGGFGATNPGRVCLNFKPPDPLITIKSLPSQPSRDIAQITIGFSSGSSDTKKITINTVGLIEIAGSNPAPPPAGVCKGEVSGGNIPCADDDYPVLSCIFPDGCTPCGCECFMFQCRDPIIGAPLCSSLGGSLCNNCGCTWWP